VGLRYNPPPGWPAAPEGFAPAPGWRPDPSWPAPPPGWQLWVSDDVPSAPGSPAELTMPAGPPAYPDRDLANPYAAANTYAAPDSFAAANQYAYAPGPYAAMGNPYAGPSQPAGATSGWAIASFILGLLGVVILGLIFGIVALKRIGRLRQRGKGLAIAGLVLSGVWLVAVIALAIVANVNSATRSTAGGTIVHKGQLGAFSLLTGDCFDNPVGARSVSRVTAIPCTQPHNAQVFARFKLSGSSFSYPGTAAAERLATSGCNARISSIDKSKTTSSMSVHFIVPVQGSWLAGQRGVSCLVVNSTETLTSSLLKP
jgi:hypothetical protein